MRETKLWIWHMVAAVAMVGLLGTHMVIMHLAELSRFAGIGSGDATQFAHVAARGRSAVFMMSYVLLLAAALFHGLYGLRTILLELSLSPRGERLLTGACWVVGVLFFLLGAGAAVAAFVLRGGAS